jgi:hypothetical protein
MNMKGKAPVSAVIRKLIARGVKASSYSYMMETMMESSINRALTSNALPTFADIAFIFMEVFTSVLSYIGANIGIYLNKYICTRAPNGN